MKRGTETSSFGVSGRIGHNSEKFYNSNLYKGINLTNISDTMENELDITNVNKIFQHSSERMIELPNNSVHLMITSPPYNAISLTVEELR